MDKQQKRVVNGKLRWAGSKLCSMLIKFEPVRLTKLQS